MVALSGIMLQVVVLVAVVWDQDKNKPGCIAIPFEMK